jgi:hypothetical protein
VSALPSSLLPPPDLFSLRQQKNAQLFKEVKSYVTEIRHYFGETSESKEGDSAQILFELLTEFASQCTSAVKDLDEWAELVRLFSPSLPSALSSLHSTLTGTETKTPCHRREYGECGISGSILFLSCWPWPWASS